MLAEAAAQVSTTSGDPNIILPALFAFGGAFITAAATILVVVLSGNRSNKVTERVHDEVRTNHGKKAGEYIEQIGPLMEWAADHQRQDNEVRVALGLDEGRIPTWRARGE